MEKSDSEKAIKAIVTLEDEKGAARLAEALSERGVVAEVRTDAAQALDYCRNSKPDLALVGVPPGIPFLRELLKASWTTNMILISDMDEETLHDHAEGLGVMGAIKSPEDREGLEALLERFFEIRARNLPG
jgi:DNA-binding response OmpR family regulator